VAVTEPWVAWAPPLDPPTAGGLPVEQAEAIAAAWWSDEPHRAAAEMWTAYAATLPPSAAVSSVQTGAQSVVYAPAIAGGERGLAIAQADWHRSFVSTLASVPLRA
jgi:hypothetical protein